MPWVPFMRSAGKSGFASQAQALRGIALRIFLLYHIELKKTSACLNLAVNYDNNYSMLRLSL